MAVYQFSALSDGQAITFNPNVDRLNFDQSSIAAANIRVTASGANTRIEVVNGADAGKDILLLGFTPLHVTTTNITFADGSRVFFGDNTTGTANDNSANTRFGTGFDDLLNGFGGADTLNGGGGDDVYFVSTGDVINEVSGTDTVHSDVSWTLGAGLENLTLIGSAAINGTGNALNNVINGNGAANSLAGGAGNDTLSGGGSEEGPADTLDGGLGDDTYLLHDDGFGLQSPDEVLSDAGGVDTVIHSEFWTLGAGFENMVLLPGTDDVDSVRGTGNALANVITASGSDWTFFTLDGGDGNDTLSGSLSRENTYEFLAGSGNYGNDVVQGGGGLDTLSFGGAETAPIVFDQRSGTLTGGGGTVSFTGVEGVVGTASDDTMTAHDGAFWDTYQGETRFEGGRFRGMEGNDELVGGAAMDWLDGGDGHDTLDGGGDIDILDGGAGFDDFVFSVTPGAANADVVGGFASGLDRLVLDGEAHAGIGANGQFAFNDARYHSASGASSGHDADDRVIYDTAGGNLWYDADGSGSGAAQLIAWLSGAPTLRADDIYVVNGSTGGTVINGTEGNDTLNGTPGNDTINGLGGNDVINGMEGADSLIGGSGNDTLDSGIFGAAGDHAADTLDGGLGNDTYRVASGQDTVLADPGGIDLVRAVGDWTLGDGLENLEFDDFVGSAWTGTGNELDNTMGSASEGGTLFGMGGNDTLVLKNVQNSSDAHGGDGNDTLRGARSSDLFGDAGNDVLVAAGILNTLNGGAGADHFVFEQPGMGADVADFASGTDKIRLDAASMTALGASGNFSAGDERFHAGATAAEADDRVIWDAGTGELWYDADGSGSGEASRIATLQAGAAVVATDIIVDNGTAPGGGTINGTAGNDSLVGTAGNDTINGLAGNDTLRGLDGDDVLDGGAGTDSLDGGLGNDTYVVTTGDVIATDAGGTDTVQTAVSWNISSAPTLENVTVTGTANTDTHGNNLNNVITGNDANNYINARGGHDTILANGGNDYIVMQTGGSSSFGEDYIAGGNGIDTVDYAAALSALVVNLEMEVSHGGEAGGGGSLALLGIEKFIGGGFADSIRGDAAQNHLHGGGGNDTLVGLAGGDSLAGGNGDDWHEGGAGFDTLSGGAGNDSFVFTASAGSANSDRVSDFTAADQLLFENAVFTGLGATGTWAAGDGRFHAAAGATAGADANDRLVYNTTNGNLYYDADGAGGAAAQIVATLAGNPSLSAADITVI